jgi:hypothetical protein
MPTASGPVRNSSHCRPMRIFPRSVRSSSFVVIGFETL